jgi:chitin synthase
VFTNWVNSHFVQATSSTFNPVSGTAIPSNGKSLSLSHPGLSWFGSDLTSQTVIFYAVLGLSAMRFAGCLLYLVFRLFGF